MSSFDLQRLPGDRDIGGRDKYSKEIGGVGRPISRRENAAGSVGRDTVAGAGVLGVHLKSMATPTNPKGLSVRLLRVLLKTLYSSAAT